jgi:hypothetical protein
MPTKAFVTSIVRVVAIVEPNGIQAENFMMDRFGVWRNETR